MLSQKLAQPKPAVQHPHEKVSAPSIDAVLDTIQRWHRHADEKDVAVMWAPGRKGHVYTPLFPYQWQQDSRQLVIPAVMQDTLTDLFCTPNAMYGRVPKDVLTKRLNAVFIDLDTEDRLGLDGDLVWQTLKQTDWFNEQGIPFPSEVNASGGGLHMYWYLHGARTEAITANTFLWRQLEKAMVERLKDWAADSGPTNPARVLRPVGTVNSKRGNAVVRNLYLSQHDEYTLEEMAGFLSVEVPPAAGRRRRGRPGSKVEKLKFRYTSRQFSKYTLNMGRMRDLNTANDMRDGFRKGHRDAVLFWYCTAAAAVGLGQVALLDQAHHLNSTFTPPLSTGEVNKVVGYALDPSRPQRFARTNTIIETLEITAAEQAGLIVIISRMERSRRESLKSMQTKKGRMVVELFDTNPGITQQSIEGLLNVRQSYVSGVLKVAGRLPYSKRGRPRKPL
ncbi:MAG: primase C-terminal domain-containing protein [Nitrospinae bacterium]|nr:primase C-terminal domain-containing protein [Nitrospinota bacterium]